LLWLTGLYAGTARWMDVVVLGWLALSLTDSPLMVGVAAFCRAAPMMVLGPFAGVLADRLPRVRVMIAVQILNVAAASALALLFGAGVAGYGVLVAIEVILGIAWVLDFPSRRTMLFVVAGRERLTAAVSLETMSMQAAKMIGPLLGGVLLARLGPAACYLTFAGLSIGALAATCRLARRVALPGVLGGEPVLDSLLAGLREVRGHPAILGVLAVTVLMNTLVFPYQQMLPVFARDVLHVGPAPLGLLVGAQGLGALVASAVIGARGDPTSHARVFAWSSLTGALLLLAFAWSPWYALSLALQLAIGATDSGFGTMQSAIVLLAAPERAQGRIMGILSACIGTQPVGSLWIGLLTSRLGAPLATGLSAALAVVLMVPVAARLVAAAPAARHRPA
ncbi:MAG TPA: MFS transporter, partial [Solirubrobacterales bacterium]|nr:MFS transporter [Solirubrobacterales bacterium]